MGGCCYSGRLKGIHFVDGREMSGHIYTVAESGPWNDDDDGDDERMSFTPACFCSTAGPRRVQARRKEATAEPGEGGGGGGRPEFEARGDGGGYKG